MRPFPVFSDTAEEAQMTVSAGQAAPSAIQPCGCDPYARAESASQPGPERPVLGVQASRSEELMPTPIDETAMEGVGRRLFAAANAVPDKPRAVEVLRAAEQACASIAAHEPDGPAQLLAHGALLGVLADLVQILADAEDGA